jgi:ubiquinone/menaquinone biosynthesis C-methylase UbiE
LTREEATRLVLPTRRVRHGSNDSSSGDLPAFVGYIDEPATERVSSRGVAVLPVRGWVASTRGRPINVSVRIGRNPAMVASCDIPRPDAVVGLGERFGAIPEPCGFQVDVPLPTEGPGTHKLTIDIDDGEFGTTRRHRVVLGGDAVPARSDYKATWDAAAVDVDSAKLAVSGYTDEDEYTRTALENVELLQQLVGVGPDDEILEIGCGVGRVGAELAPLCKRWVGADVSANMLSHARDRLRGFDNVELVELSGWDLAPVPSESLDVVYCTVVFMHLDEWERYSYVCEAMRVLRPGGRFYVDNFNLLSDPGWEFFMAMKENHHPLLRPPNISKSSTPDEIRTYLERAGFDEIKVSSGKQSLWLGAHARKKSG